MPENKSWIRRGIEKVLGPVIQAELAKADKPNTTEVPTQLTVGYGYSGGARRKYGGMMDFDSLRTFSVVYDVARACINYRKRQMANLEWTIVPVDDEAEVAQFKKPIEEITAFFKKPAHGHDFKMWLDKLMEDLLVLDAGVMWKDKTFGNKLKELLPVDGATIRLRMAPDGIIPEPPEPAYDQVIYGQVKGSYTTEEMYYKILNPRNNTPYGLSPLECLIIGVDAALRSQMYNASLLSEGTVPEGFFGMPESWTADQIKDYQMWFDALMAGNFGQNSRIKFMPGGKGVGYIPTKKVEDMRMMEFEKWLLLKTCAMFDTPPAAIGFIENMPQNPGEGQQQFGNERGLVPMANFLKTFFTQIIAEDFGRTDLKFEWKGLQVVDDTFELDRNDRMIGRGAMTINEWRVAQGLDPLEDPNADEALIYTPGGAMLLSQVGKTPEGGDPIEDEPMEDKQEQEQKDMLEEMQKWEDKAINYLKRGKGIPSFKASHIDSAVYALIAARLSVCKSRDEVKAAFAPFKRDLMERVLIKEVVAVKDKVSRFKRNAYEPTRQGNRGS